MAFRVITAALVVRVVGTLSFIATTVLMVPFVMAMAFFSGRFDGIFAFTVMATLSVVSRSFLFFVFLTTGTHNFFR